MRARVIAYMDGLRTGVQAIYVQMGDVMDGQRLDLSSLIGDGPRAVCEEIVKLAVADFTAASVNTLTTAGARSASSREAPPLEGTTILHLDVVPLGSVLLPAEACEAYVIKMAFADLIGDVFTSHPSGLHALNALSLAGSGYDRSSAAGQDFPFSAFMSHAAADPSDATGAVPFEAKSVRGTRSTLLTNQTSVAIASNRTAISNFPQKSDSGSINRSGLGKKLGVKCGSKTIKKSDKTGRRSKVVRSPLKIKIEVPPFSAAASTAGASFSASSTHDVSIVEIDEHNALTIPSCSLSG